MDKDISELQKSCTIFALTESVTLQIQGINVFTLKEVYLKKWLLHFTLREMHFLVGNYDTCIQKATPVLPSAAKRIFPNKPLIELNSLRTL